MPFLILISGVDLISKFIIDIVNSQTKPIFSFSSEGSLLSEENVA